ncbi:MAG: acyltransferase family protein [Acidimicrobiia bacterium]
MTGPPTRRVPALDGLRGLALVGMLLWHAEVGWLQGGFVRMTAFFSLSGYLAARSLQRLAGSPRPLRTFWARRAVRLLPVAHLGVGVAVVATAWDGTPGMRARLAGDTAAVLADVSNVRFWRSGQGYGRLTDGPSLLQHMWTLSIEEQCLVVLPVLLAGVAWWARRRPGREGRRAVAVVALLAVAGAGLPAVVRHAPDAAWYSSLVRGGEFLAGVALALALPAGARPAGRAGRALGAAGAAGLAALVGTMVLVPRDAAWLYRGGMALFLVPVLACLAAAATSTGPAARLLALRPLAALGRWTFSIYVLHWPLFWVLDPARTGLDGAALATLRLAAAVAAGWALHVTVERPLIERARPTGRHRAPAGARRAVPVALAGSVVALLGAGLAVGAGAHPPATVGELVAASSGPVPGDRGRVSVATFGGSTALVYEAQGWAWSAASADVELRGGAGELGCTLVNEGWRPTFYDEATRQVVWDRPDDVCFDWPDRWARAAAASRPDVALVLVGTWEVVDVDLDGVGRTHVGDPAYDALLRDRLELAVGRLQEAGAGRVVLATTPVVGRGAQGDAWARRDLGDDHPARVAAFNAVVRAVAAAHPEVGLVDYGGWVDALDDAERDALLPDGVHPTAESTAQVWERFLGPAVLDAARPGAGSTDDVSALTPWPPPSTRTTTTGSSERCSTRCSSGASTTRTTTAPATSPA